MHGKQRERHVNGTWGDEYVELAEAYSQFTTPEPNPGPKDHPIARKSREYDNSQELADEAGERIRGTSRNGDIFRLWFTPLRRSPVDSVMGSRASSTTATKSLTFD